MGTIYYGGSATPIHIEDRALAHLKVLGQHQPRIRFVIPEHDIEARFQALDEIGLEQQGLGFGVGRDDLDRNGLAHHPPQPFRQSPAIGVGRDPFAQAAGLADLQSIPCQSSMR